MRESAHREEPSDKMTKAQLLKLAIDLYDEGEHQRERLLDMRAELGEIRNIAEARRTVIAMPARLENILYDRIISMCSQALGIHA